LLNVRSDWSKLIAVEVGGSKPEVASQSVELDYDTMRTFQVYEDSFRAQSPFFEAALGRDFIEAHDRIVKLPEHTPAAFEIYLRWVYSRRIVIPFKAKKIEPEDDRDRKKMVRMNDTATFNLMCRAYILGDVLQDVDYKDALIDAIIHQMRTASYWPVREAKFVYGNTMKNSPLRRVLVAMTATELFGISNDVVYGEKWRKYNTLDFLSDIMELLDRRLSPGSHEENSVKWDENTCRYHEHEEGRCYRARIGASEVKPKSSPLAPSSEASST
jgi:hypothetical protein